MLVREGDRAGPTCFGRASSAFFFVPIVLSTAGANGSLYTTELIFTYRGTTSATLELKYEAMIGTETGPASDVLAPGEHWFVPDGFAYLRGLGVPIPASGHAGGTLDVVVTGLSSPDAIALTVRTTSPTASPLPEGAAGVAFPSPYRGDGGRPFRPRDPKLGGRQRHGPSDCPLNGANVAPGGIRFVRWDGTSWVAEIVSEAG